MSDETQELVRMHRKRIILEYAIGTGNILKACQEFNVNRSTSITGRKPMTKKDSKD